FTIQADITFVSAPETSRLRKARQAMDFQFTSSSFTRRHSQESHGDLRDYAVTPDERSLIDSCRRGNALAWNELVARYEKPVYKFAYALSRNHDDASDIAGQVLVRLYENIHSFRNESNFASWVFRIARNVYVDTCIRAPHRGHVSLDDGIDLD